MASAGRKIMVVEDQAIVAMTIVNQLQEMGYEVAGTAATGEDAIQLARDTSPDLILMDINLQGDMDGITAASRIELFLDSPVIYLTAYSDEETIKRACLTSPFSYLTKPYKLRDLYSNIEMAMYKRKLATKEGLRERRLQTMLKMVSDPLIATDESGTIIVMNDSAGDLIGTDPAEALEKPLGEVFRLKDGADTVLFSNTRQIDPESPGLLGFPFQCTIINKKSVEIPVLTSTSMIKSPTGGYGGLLLVFRDCRPMIAIRHKLANLENNIQVILDAIMVPVVIINPGLLIEGYNLAFADWCREIGISSDLEHKNIKNIARLLKTIRPAQLNQVLESGRAFLYEEEIEIGKQNLTFEIRFTPLEEKGKTEHIMITIRDNTAEKRLKKAGIMPVAENKQVINNIVSHFSDMLGCLMEIRSLSLLEDPSVEKDWISEQIVRYIEKAEKTSSELYEIFLRELSGKHTFNEVYTHKKKQIGHERDYVFKSRR